MGNNMEFFKTENDSAKQMVEVKEWLQGSFFIQELKEENETLSCLSLEEVEELLRKCACELGIEYEGKQ